jgi:hypothetical protein
MNSCKKCETNRTLNWQFERAKQKTLKFNITFNEKVRQNLSRFRPTYDLEHKTKNLKIQHNI